jgi:Concanavalin A-like lectin/glucanases superfamily
MLDPYLLTAPVLLLAIAILLRFVGCSFQPGSVGANTAVTLTAQACNGNVTLAWTVTNPPSDTGVSYQIYRNGTPLPGTITNATSYTDPDLTNGTTYSYKVAVLYGGGVSATSNTVIATPAALPGRPPGATLDMNNPLSQNLIGLFLMNDAQGQPDASPADDTNIKDAIPVTPSGAIPPTWVLADPSINFYGGAPLASYLDAGVDGAFDNMPTSQISIVAKVFLNSTTPPVPEAICEKNDDNMGSQDSGFLFGVTNTLALRFIVELSITNMKIQSADNQVPQNQWVQVAFTWDGTQSTGPASAAALYVNGVLQTPASETNGNGILDGSKASNSQPFRIGNASYESIEGSFFGKMAYMAVYKGRLLSPSDMMALDAMLPIVYPTNLTPCAG